MNTHRDSVPQMRPVQDLRLEITKILNNSNNIPRASESLIGLIRAEREAMLTEIRSVLNRRDPDYSRVVKYLDDMAFKNRPLET